MESETLEKLGLNKNEAKVYLILLELGQSQAGAISKKIQINRTTTYEVIERLLDKGLLTYVIEANKKIFKPVEPNKLLERVKEQEKTTEEILPELNKIYKTSKETEESNIYKGKKGIKSILQDILKCKEYVAFGSKGQFLEIMKYDFTAFQKRKKELKIKSRIILSINDKKSESVEIAFAEFRFIPNEYTSLTTTFVYNDQTAIIIWSETPIATVIKNKEVAESYKNYFELVWKTAKL